MSEPWEASVTAGLTALFAADPLVIDFMAAAGLGLNKIQTPPEVAARLRIMHLHDDNSDPATLAVFGLLSGSAFTMVKDVIDPSTARLLDMYLAEEPKDHRGLIQALGVLAHGSGPAVKMLLTQTATMMTVSHAIAQKDRSKSYQTLSCGTGQMIALWTCAYWAHRQMAGTEQSDFSAAALVVCLQMDL